MACPTKLSTVWPKPLTDTCGSAILTNPAGVKSGGGDGQAGVYRDGRLQTLLHFGPPIIRLAAARAGGIWICSGSQLFKYDEGGNREEFGSFLPRYTSTKPRVMLEDSSGAVWIGTSDSGLFRYD